MFIRIKPEVFTRQQDFTEILFTVSHKVASALRSGDLTKLRHLTTFFSSSYSPGGTKQWVGREHPQLSTSFLVVSIVFGKRKNATASDSIVQWTMGTFSVDANDAVKDERKKMSLRDSHDT